MESRYGSCRCKRYRRICHRYGIRAATGLHWWSSPVCRERRKIAVSDYERSVDALCAELQQQTHTAETAQEIILSRVFQGFESLLQSALALFSLSDVGLSREEISTLLINSLNISPSSAASLIRKMRATGTIEIYGNQTLKVHDAVRG